ncbi:MAG: type II toxin-antitoxin system VapC family toxin [Planctomycetales bacterium]|nr:type II toxin-antitoxin system VapC family toxin [Planctomycetales bacterium]
MTYLLDTQVLTRWLLEPRRLSRRQRGIVDTARPERPLLVSDMSLLETARLVRGGGIALNRPLREWLEEAVAPPLVEVKPISAAITVEAVDLPPSFPKDPVDRIVVATARIYGATLLTSDRAILSSGLVPTIA